MFHIVQGVWHSFKKERRFGFMGLYWAERSRYDFGGDESGRSEDGG